MAMKMRMKVVRSHTYAFPLVKENYFKGVGAEINTDANTVQQNFGDFLATR